MKRELPWSLGKNLNGTANIDEALKMAELNWEVIQQPVAFQTPDKKFIVVENRLMNVRSTDLKPLGIVGKSYQILQNRDAFNFANDLLGEGVTFEAAGSAKGGKRVWLLAKLPEGYKVLDDKIDPFFCLNNSFDTVTGIMGAVTPVRVHCSNILDFTFKNAKRVWKIYHNKQAHKKLEEARNTLNLTRLYYQTLENQASKLGDIKVKYDQLVAELFPYDSDSGQLTIRTMDEKRTQLYACLEAPDLKPYKGTAWAFVNAVSDMLTHAEPGRKVKDLKGWKENRMLDVMDGYELFDKAYVLVTNKKVS
jgi:phage/plasmid-like protein (TIGR03299 family)